MIRSDRIQITPEILKLIAELDELKASWHRTGTLRQAQFTQ